MKVTARARTLGALLAAAWIASFGGPAHAQYVFLDVNGDAACTTADVLTSSTTTVDVYLDTNHNADGTVRTCAANPSQPLDIFSYDLVLRQSGSGSVTFNSYTNALPGFEVLNPLTSANGDAGVTYSVPPGGNLAPGRYKLGTFSVSVTGTPTLAFVGFSSNSAVPSFGTGFGTSCDASTFANTMVLGFDFDDACGTGGTIASPNAPPVLNQPSDMTVTAGAVADQAVTATDPNGDTITFLLLAAPSYVTLTPTNSGAGTATADIRVAPPLGFTGKASVSVQASDGRFTVAKTFQVTVPPASPSNHPPSLSGLSSLSVSVGSTADETITATDPDPDTLTFSLVTAPTYATLTTTGSEPGSATATLHFAPSTADVGSSQVLVRVSDGAATTERSLTVSVMAPPPPNSGPTLSAIHNVSIMDGDVLDIGILAQDGDADPMTFSFTGPPFMSLVPMAQSGTDRRATVHLAPPVGPGGTYAASVTVTSRDGTATQSFTIDVTTCGVTALPPAQQPGPPEISPSVGEGDPPPGDPPAGTPSSVDPPASATNPVFDATASLSMENRILRLETHTRTWSVEIASVGSSFRSEDVLPSSVIATYDGAEVRAIGWNGGVAVFDMGDLRTVLAGLPDGKSPIDLVLTGDLGSASFRAPVRVEVEKGSAFARNYGRAVPNPFNPSTTISFDVARAGRVRLRVFDAHGRLVRELTDRQVDAGYQEVRWDGTASGGARVASGIYFYVLETPDGTTRSRLVLAR